MLENPPLTPLLRAHELTFELLTCLCCPCTRQLQALFNNVRYAKRSRCGPQPRGDGEKNKGAGD